jgi:hypothetical protein
MAAPALPLQLWLDPTYFQVLIPSHVSDPSQLGPAASRPAGQADVPETQALNQDIHHNKIRLTVCFGTLTRMDVMMVCGLELCAAGSCTNSMARMKRCGDDR